MIAVDTSALMAIVLNEPEADACVAALENEDDLLISAGTADCSMSAMIFPRRISGAFSEPDAMFGAIT